jgi:signal transduction histidine kinase
MGTFGPLEGQQAEVTKQIVESVHFLNAVINDLLDEAQISAQKIVLHMERFSLHALLKNVESNMNMLAGRKNLSFSLSMAPDLPEFIVGDGRRIQQIIVNLAGNAIKYTNTGQVSVKAFRHDRSNWEIQVCDTGVGIPHGALQTIFEPFHQVDTAAKNSNRGTGLGLTITKQLVELMGGKIIVQSEINQGSTFSVILPLIENMERPRAQTGHLNRRG